MKTLIIHALCLAFAAWDSSIATAETKSQYGGFSLDKIQVFYDYIHGQEMMKVEAGSELRQAVETVPIDLGAPINFKQEGGLRNWLYDFLVAFSPSGSDSLAAAFYLREGINNPTSLEMLENYLKSEAPNLLEGDTPLEIFKAGHRYTLAELDRDYFFGNVSFFDSVFKVFKMQEEYASYQSYADIHGMIPRGIKAFPLSLRGEVEERLQYGEQMVFADIMFIVEELEEFTTFETPGRTPSFFRLVWDSERAIWRHVEAFFSYGVPQKFLFGI